MNAYWQRASVDHAMQNVAASGTGRRHVHLTMHGEYIDGTFDGPSLCGNDPKERAVVHMMNRRAEAGLVFADFAKVEIPANLTNLIAWRARVSARPSVAG